MIHRQILSLIFFIVLFQSSKISSSSSFSHSFSEGSAHVDPVPTHTECKVPPIAWSQIYPYGPSHLIGGNKCEMLLDERGFLALYFYFYNAAIGTWQNADRVWLAPLYAIGKAPFQAVFQKSDGNFVVYDVNNVPVWDSHVNPDAWELCLSTNCDLYFVMKDNSRRYLYQSQYPPPA